MKTYRLDKKLVAQSFGKAAAHYDDVAVLQRRTADSLLEQLASLPLQPNKILDLGAGTGRNIALLKRRFPDAQLFAVDIAPEMVQQAKQRYLDDDGKASYLVGDAEKLPLADNSIDLVFANLTLQWCDTETGFYEISRILRSGGSLVFTSLGPYTLHELRQCWAQVDDYAHINTFDDIDNISTKIASTRLTAPILDTDKLTLFYDSSMALMKDLKTLGASNANIGRRPGLTSKRAFTKVAQTYEQFRIEGLLPATYQVIYGTAWSDK